MAKILYLTHRIPYPPDKGDKITTYHFLKHLAKSHQVFLGTFVDDSTDWQYVDKVRALCQDICVREFTRTRRQVAGVRALFSGQSITASCYRDATLARWVDETVAKQGIKTSIVYCSAVAQFLLGARYESVRRIAHFADVDSQKWRDYADRHPGPMGWVYAREGRTLLEYERSIASRFDATTFVTDADAELFRRLAPESANRISVIENGVDTEYFDPRVDFANPYPGGGPVIVFTGVMDYWANVDAVTWFAEEVMPFVRKGCADARFCIVGSRPTQAVMRLSGLPGVSVTGRVSDVRPYLKFAAAAVAPLRVARGTQNKVLEALAMGKRILLTRGAAEGMRRTDWLDAAVAEEPDALAQLALAAIAQASDHPSGRAYVEEYYSWDAHLSRLDALLGA